MQQGGDARVPVRWTAEQNSWRQLCVRLRVGAGFQCAEQGKASRWGQQDELTREGDPRECVGWSMELVLVRSVPDLGRPGLRLAHWLSLGQNHCCFSNVHRTLLSSGSCGCRRKELTPGSGVPHTPHPQSCHIYKSLTAAAEKTNQLQSAGQSRGRWGFSLVLMAGARLGHENDLQAPHRV